jgi:iron-sulfur cluster repair protein YtfE (RIC family)
MRGASRSARTARTRFASPAGEAHGPEQHRRLFPELSYVKARCVAAANNGLVTGRTEPSMGAIESAMNRHHAHCDEIFASVRSGNDRKSWDTSVRAFHRFRREMEHHFAGEESVLFPAFEAATGMQQGPTLVMRGEHDAMRSLFAQVDAALTAHDEDGADGTLSTLLILMQQHNVKEENILYPMMDSALQDRALALVAALDLVLTHE